MVKLDADGLANGSKFTDLCVLTGVTATLDTLLADGNIALTWRGTPPPIVGSHRAT